MRKIYYLNSRLYSEKYLKYLFKKLKRINLFEWNFFFISRLYSEKDLFKKLKMIHLVKWEKITIYFLDYILRFIDPKI
jgi:hypothetical protein